MDHPELATIRAASLEQAFGLANGTLEVRPVGSYPRPIPVVERLPEDDDFVLAWCRSPCCHHWYWMAVNYSGGNWYGHEDTYCVTHWLPLPPSPEAQS